MEDIVLNVIVHGVTYPGRIERIIDDHLVLRGPDRIHLLRIDDISGFTFKSDVTAKRFQTTKILM